ncbi:HPr family phosphocarrier protein [Elioraea tepida]|jgi:phosphocarrier protein|uniref:HPr family phosphocarrier protein n=1 Tax=Elioraea tepida TaxID=2843330 RepID=A0A975U1L7_9PROT|nr:HPr family phosphocarrier protein [Elioraea tepida]QXM23688.1 HPr family phosphocarrier protein [Elioraea tepida]
MNPEESIGEDWPKEGPSDPADPFPAERDPNAPPPLVRELVIRNQRGLHARAAAKFVKLAETFSACITVRKNGMAVSGRSIMGLMMLGAGQGCPVILEAEGWDAREALDALAGLIEAGFHED